MSLLVGQVPNSKSNSDPEELWFNNINTDFVQKIRKFCDLYTEIVKIGLEALL